MTLWLDRVRKIRDSKIRDSRYFLLREGTSPDWIPDAWIDLDRIPGEPREEPTDLREIIRRTTPTAEPLTRAIRLYEVFLDVYAQIVRFRRQSDPQHAQYPYIDTDPMREVLTGGIGDYVCETLAKTPARVQAARFTAWDYGARFWPDDPPQCGTFVRRFVAETIRRSGDGVLAPTPTLSIWLVIRGEVKAAIDTVPRATLDSGRSVTVRDNP